MSSGTQAETSEQTVCSGVRKGVDKLSSEDTKLDGSKRQAYLA